ncbi:connectin [Anabrus simplex]|uniref:connectin n=1 Tax=Anabrus simplex TaxID=316456 RepID=UPI0035A3A8F5
MTGKYLLLFVVCSAILVHSVSARGRKEKDKKKTHKGHDNTINLCDIRETGINVFCYCNSQEIQNATESTCWIFNGEKPPDHAVWDYFVTQTKLQKLKFNIRPDGKLQFVPTKALSHLRELTTFDIQYASIHEIPPYAFGNLSSLTEINLSRNQIVVLKSYSFSRLPKLSVITLDENRIAELHRDVFVLPQLTKLYIARNNLSILHDRAFSHLHRLEELELNGNQLTVVTRETFSGLKSLKRLDLYLNHLSMLGDFTFSEMPSLDELELGENDIQFISDRAFDGLKKLTKLNLGENKLHSLGNDLFAPVPNIHLLDLRENQLTTLTFDTVNPLMENLKNITTTLYIEGNRFTCDCRLSWMYQLRNETPNEQVRNALEELTCILKEPLDYEASPTADTTTESTVRDFVRDEPDEDLSYDDEDTLPEDDETATSLPDYRRHLFQIPPQMLPCPEELHAAQDTTEQPYLTSDYGYGHEMVAKTSSASSMAGSAAILLLATTTLVALIT